MKGIQFETGRGLFVTGTDTGVGKTVVAVAMARQLRLAGYRVGVFKPIATGCESRREGLVSRDAEFLAHCADCRFSLNEINPVTYREPLAPLAAAERSQRDIDWAALALGYRNMVRGSDIVIVEGIGGVMVPLAKDTLVIDLMVEMKLPVLIVARSRLGTLNHTLLTVEMCRMRGLKVAGVVLNGYRSDSADLAEESNARIITEVGKVEVAAVIPYDKETCVERGKLGAEVRSAAALIRWEEKLEG